MKKLIATISLILTGLIFTNGCESEYENKIYQLHKKNLDTIQEIYDRLSKDADEYHRKKSDEIEQWLKEPNLSTRPSFFTSGDAMKKGHPLMAKYIPNDIQRYVLLDNILVEYYNNFTFRQSYSPDYKQNCKVAIKQIFEAHLQEYDAILDKITDETTGRYDRYQKIIESR